MTKQKRMLTFFMIAALTNLGLIILKAGCIQSIPKSETTPVQAIGTADILTWLSNKIPPAKRRAARKKRAEKLRLAIIQLDDDSLEPFSERVKKLRQAIIQSRIDHGLEPFSESESDNTFVSNRLRDRKSFQRHIRGHYKRKDRLSFIKTEEQTSQETSSTQ